MTGTINQERVNDRAKLLMHRLVARRLGRDPELLGHAQQALNARARRMPDREFSRDWETLLASPISELRRKLTSRQEEMARLRLSSPFMLVPHLGLDEVHLRRRIWRLAKRGALRQAAMRTVNDDARPSP